MYDVQKEIDTIETEHRYMSVGDPVPVNRFDEHDLHIEKHEAFRKTLDNKEESVLKQAEIDFLDAHIALHKEMKKSI